MIHSFFHRNFVPISIQVQEVIILAAHDGAVMMNWAKSQKTALTMLTFLGDPHSELTRALDLELTHPGPVNVLGPGRCKRFAMHVVDGEIMAVSHVTRPVYGVQFHPESIGSKYGKVMLANFLKKAGLR